MPKATVATLEHAARAMLRHVREQGGRVGALARQTCAIELSPRERSALSPVFAFAVIVAALPLAVATYAYAVYPALLWVAVKFRRQRSLESSQTEWPSVTVTVPVYNGAASIQATLQSLLDLDYPRDRLQLLVVSDASTDGTDDVVRQFADRGVELLRLPQRLGKTAAENAAVSHSRGEILVNVDAAIIIPPLSLKKLVAVLSDPSIGVASGRDISVGAGSNGKTAPEAGYVGYEMWVRSLETRIGSIVGASGCFYASRRQVHGRPLPQGLSWDFAAVLEARLQGFRSVSVPDALCIVPRTGEIRTELRRKARTMARGIQTLFYHAALMNPARYGAFAFMLISHKLLRWVPYLLAPLAYVSLCFIALDSAAGRAVLAVITFGLCVGITGIRLRRKAVATPVAFAGFVVAVFAAGFIAWRQALRRTQLAVWEPSQRPVPLP